MVQFSGSIIQRHAAQLRGVRDEQPAWVWAVGMLKLARMLGDQVASADSFLIEDVEECAGAIDRAVGAVEARGIESLILRLPKGAAKMPERQ